MGLPDHDPAPDMRDVPTTATEQFGADFTAGRNYLDAARQQELQAEATRVAGGRWNSLQEEQFPGAGNMAEADINAGVWTAPSIFLGF